jgi:hypothetical protein
MTCCSSAAAPDSWWGVLLGGLIGSIVGGLATGAAVVWGFRAEGRRLARLEAERLNSEVRKYSWPLLVNHPDVEDPQTFARNSLLADRTAIVDLLTSVDATAQAAKLISPKFAAEQKALANQLWFLVGEYSRRQPQQDAWRPEHEARLRLVLQDILNNAQEYATNPQGTFSSSRHREFVESVGLRARFEGENAEQT